VYAFNVPSTYSEGAGSGTGQSKIDFEVYDPDTYDNGVDAHGTYDEMNKAPTGDTSNKEQWLYTLWKGGLPGATGAQVVAQAVYGENSSTSADQQNTNDHWVTPSSAFSFDTAGDFGNKAMTNADGSVTYHMSVQSTNGVANGSGVYPTGPGTYGTGYDENGYLVRAGPPHTAMNTLSIDQTTSQALSTTSTYGTPAALKARTDLMDPYATDPATKETYDALWSNTFGPLSKTGPSGVSMEVLTQASMNDNGKGTSSVPIYFGFAPGLAGGTGNTSASVTINFYGWDEDSGATGITYTCDALPGQTFTGKIGGNEAWSTDSFTFPPGTYPSTGGNWTANYTTGLSDNTTWRWSDTAETIGGASVHLTYTTSNVF
jgi:hypothetical protein